MATSGLDYVSNEETSGQQVPVKETISVGGAKVPVKTAINSDIIKNLQDEIEKRQGGFLNPVLRGFERAAAFTSRDPGAALAANDASRRAEDESIFGMRNSIATIKAAQQQAAARQAQWNAMPQASGAGGTGQAQANTGDGGVSISPQQLAIESGLETADEKIASRQKYFEQLNQANARGQAEAAGNKQEEYRDPRTGAIIGYFTPNQVKANPSLISGAVATGNTAPSQTVASPTVSNKVAFTPTGNGSFDDALGFVLGQEGGYKDKDGNTGNPVNFGVNQKFHPNVDVKKLTIDQARDIYKSEYWDAIGGDKLNPIVAKIALDAAVNQGPEYAKKLIAETGGDPVKMMAHRLNRYADTVSSDATQAPNLKGWVNRLNALQTEIGQPGSVPATASNASTPTNPITTRPGLSPIESHNIDVKNAQNAADAAKAGKEEEEKKAADYMAAIQSGRKDLPGILSAAQTIQQHAKDHPRVFFYPGRGGAGALTELPGVGEPMANVYASFADDAKTRAEIKQASAALGVENAKNLFAGLAARFGAQLTGIGTTSKGVGVDLPAETNKFNARMMELTSLMAQEQAKEYQKFKGGNGNAFEFLQSPENQAIEQRYLGLLAKEFPGRINLNSGPPPAEPKIGDVMDGHRYKGGGAHDPKNWEKV
jgi:hypothetical protein